MAFRSIKGTKDILPEDVPKWQYVEDVLRQLTQAYNYKEIRTPVFEETALFARGIGDLTDIVSKEMYTFTDRSGDSLTLRPEMTAGVLRAYIQYNIGEQQPLTKLYYIAPIFRQERPQAGRFRQFHQFGIEAVGSQDAALDAEVIGLAVELYRRIGIPKAILKINSVGCEVCRPLYRTVLKNHLARIFERLSSESQNRFDQNPLRILDSKNENDQKLTADAPLMKDHLCLECAEHFRSLQHHLTNLEIAYEVDGRIVRGLDYYTKTAFELLSPDLGSQDALAGGGRYDLLIEQIGGKRTPGVGFAAGIERILMVMDKQKLSFGDDRPLSLFIVTLDDHARLWGMKAIDGLRRLGISCETDYLRRSVKAQMREADRQHARYVLVVGSDELETQRGKLKNMREGSEEEINIAELTAVIQTRVSS
ncbi:MAG: histidine--tRNA ligase [Bacteroidota bacterium]